MKILVACNLVRIIKLINKIKNVYKLSYLKNTFMSIDN